MSGFQCSKVPAFITQASNMQMQTLMQQDE